MIALQIENVKDFMTCLFQGDMFDKFLVNGCEIKTFVNFETDGKKNHSWYDTGEDERREEAFVRWKELKPAIFSLIRGKKTPAKMNISMCHYMADGDMGSLRIQFEDDKLFVFTGYMQQNFTLDKGKQQQWDENCMKFLIKNKIVSTHLE